MLRHSEHLLFLDLYRHGLELVGDLQQEKPLSLGANRSSRKAGRVEHAESFHQLGTRLERSSPVLFVARTIGPPEVYITALIEHGETTMR